MKKKILHIILIVMMMATLNTGVVFSATSEPFDDLTQFDYGDKPYATITIPVKKIVQNVSIEEDAPKQTFTYEISGFGAEADCEIVENEIETDGEGKYKGNFVINVNSEEDYWNLTEGFSIIEKSKEDDGWKYDETEWYVIPGAIPSATTLREDSENKYYNLTEGDDPYTTETEYEGISFTNIYEGYGNVTEFGKIFKLTYDLNYESSVNEKEEYPQFTTVNITKIPSRPGYAFEGWYSEPELKNKVNEVYMIKDTTVYAGWKEVPVPDSLNGDNHEAYILGYEDGTVRPKANITRAEVSMIFYRLLKNEVREANFTTENKFTDVKKGQWYNDAISTMAKLGILKGRTDTTFEPNAAITRAEYTAICSRFDKTVANGEVNFTDIDGHWAKNDIIRTVYLGWIKGYEDNTFKPNNKITRAESVTLTNRVLQRIPQYSSDLLAGMNVFPDNKESDWYYLAVQEASNSHNFERKSNGYEHWTSLIKK